MRLLVDPRRDGFVWALKPSGPDAAVIAHGKVEFIESLADVAKLLHAKEVFIDCGFRTAEVRQMCERHGWTAVKALRGPNGIYPPQAIEIEEATKAA